MNRKKIEVILKKGASDYGMVLVLIFLIGLFSALTITEEEISGPDAGRSLANRIINDNQSKNVVIITSIAPDDVEMSETAERMLLQNGHRVIQRINADPPTTREILEMVESSGTDIDFLLVTQGVARWSLIKGLGSRFEVLRNTQVIYPVSRRFPRFLQKDNLRNVADRIAVIAILAIGMTMVIITAGIDLSVGSLIALSAVATALFIREIGGGIDAGPLMLITSSALAILLCAILGFFSGALSTTYKIAPFIATLAMMMIARGLAYKFSNVETIPINNEAFAWLGKGRIAGIPVSVGIMALLYAWAYFMMHSTTLGRYIYAIGGNKEAARLSGVPVRKVLILVYTLCALLAGLGGVITASNLAGGAATYGDYYELYTIAAVVVGGTSLMGGEGKVLGTLIGAFIIAVIQSGMNQVGIESNTQKVVFGVVIIGAIVVDNYKRGKINTQQIATVVLTIAGLSFAVYLFLKSFYPENF